MALTGIFLIDDDERWTRVPDDHVAMTRGVPLNSLREFGDDAEYEDLENFMRRDSRNEGCQKDLTLGVTYSAMSPTSDSRVPGNYRKPRQTVSVGLQRGQMKVDMWI